MGRAAAVLLSDPVSGAGFPLCVYVCVYLEHVYVIRNNSSLECGFVSVT